MADKLKPLTKEELGESLCDYCELEESKKGVFFSSTSDGPVFCTDYDICDKAYDCYLDELEQEGK